MSLKLAFKIALHGYSSFIQNLSQGLEFSNLASV
jgi:hypothetical protein